MSRIAGVVITRNEEANIERCLRSLAFCDEIIVVDSESSDKTVPIAKKFASRVVTRPWPGYTDQKNYAVSLSTTPWVVSIDADEEVSEELREEIKQRSQSDEVVAFFVPRKTIHSGRWIRYGGWYPNYLVRVFRRDQGAWVGDQVHEFWQPAGEVGYLRGHIIHHSFTSIADQVERNNRYSGLLAARLYSEGQSFSGWKLVTKPCVKFLETYLLKRGFLDGYPGLMIAVSAAYSVFLKWAKLWELTRDSKKKI